VEFNLKIMKLSFSETTPEQDADLQRTLDVRNAANGTALTLEEYAAIEWAAKLDEHRRYWASEDFSKTSAEINAKLVTFTKEDLDAAKAAVEDIASKP
jgi:hypothetical protein